MAAAISSVFNGLRNARTVVILFLRCYRLLGASGASASQPLDLPHYRGFLARSWHWLNRDRRTRGQRTIIADVVALHRHHATCPIVIASRAIISERPFDEASSASPPVCGRPPP
jgi:hypothetical protein